MMYPLLPKIDFFYFSAIFSNHMFLLSSRQADYENISFISLRPSVQKLWAFKVSSACIIGYNFWTQRFGELRLWFLDSARQDDQKNMSFDTIREYLKFCVFWTVFLKGRIRKNRIFELVVPFISRNQQSTIQSIRLFLRYKSEKK